MADFVMPSNSVANPLIPIVQMEDQGIQAVVGRDLHQFLGIKTPYKDWFPRMVDYGFEEGVDYVHKIEHSSSPAGMPQRPRINHFVSLDMAKEIAMIQRTDRGKQARQYFIECEKKARATVQQPEIPRDYAEALRAAADNFERAQRAEAEAVRKTLQLEAAAPKADYYDAYVAEEDLIAFRTLANQLGIGEQHLRRILVQHKWIYDAPVQRWSNSQQRKVTEHRWRCMADKKRYFRLVANHQAPRLLGEVQQTLKITPEGARAILQALIRWGELTQTLPLEAAGEVPAR